MFRDIDTSDARAVQAEVASIYDGLFPGRDSAFIPRAFQWLLDCFSGRHPGYQSIDASYHNLEHTLQVTLCYARLLEGYRNAGAQPAFTERSFELALIAILLHDTGYLKKQGDNHGTGAKYTLVHVARSAEFAAAFLRDKGYAPHEILSIQNMIRCTGVNADFSAIPFQSELEKILGFALATADLIGQMAAPDYIDKLGILFQEFEEASRHAGQAANLFSSAEDLRRKTPAFWQGYVLPRINGIFGGMHRYLARPLLNGRNAYLESIEANMDRLRSSLAPV